MRRSPHILLALMLGLSPAAAADTAALPPGKPAGVQQANTFRPNYPVIFVGAAVVALAAGLYLSSHNTTASTGTSP